MIHQLIYHSESVVRGGNRDMLFLLRDILSTAQRNNARAGITGFLIFDKVRFVQILEGERTNVADIYRRISADRRHANLTIVNARDVEQRMFAKWAMGGVLQSPEVQSIYLRHGINGKLDPTRVSGKRIIDLALDLQSLTKGERAYAED